MGLLIEHPAVGAGWRGWHARLETPAASYTSCMDPAVTVGCLVLCIAVLCVFRLINRELVAWMPDDNSLDPNLYALEDSGESGWDQIAVNRKKFGYESGWNEDFYTVKLDKNK